MGKKFKLLNNCVVVKGTKGRTFIASAADQLESQGFARVAGIVSNLSKNPGELFMTKRNGYHSLLSVIGNGRWRDRGVSTELLMALLQNSKVTKKLRVGYKITDDGVEPVIETQSLQKMLTDVKEHITPDGNGLTATLKYQGTKVKLNVEQYARIKTYL